MKGIQVLGRSGVEIERAAARVRRLLVGEAYGRPVDGVNLFEHAIEDFGQALTCGTPVTYGVRELPGGIEGYSEYVADQGRFCVTLSERTYRGLVCGESRPLFTLCHEVGHLAMHHKALKRLKTLPHTELMMQRNHSRHAAFEDSEWQANRFASAMLMPASGLERLRALDKLDEEHVARRYRTSYPAANLRIQQFRERRHELVTAWK